MSSELEGLLYFGIMGIVLLVIIAFAIKRMKKTAKFKNTMIQVNALSLLLFFLACIWWFFQASDGFSQVFGWFIYGIAFVLSVLLNLGILLYMKKKSA